MAAKYPSDSDRLEDVFQDEVVNAFAKMYDFKKFARSGRGLCLDESDIENIVAEYRIVEEQKFQLLMKWKEKRGPSATASNIRSLVEKFKAPDSKKAPTGESSLQGPSQSQAIAETSIQDALPQVDEEVPGAEGVQLAASSNRTSVCQECLKMSVSNSQTNEPSLHLSAIMEGLAVSPSHDRSALEMNTLYEKEETKQDVGDLLPFLETTWKLIQAKINLKSSEKQLVHEVEDFYKLGELFASEDNFIHAVNSFYTAANLHRISNKRNNSVIDIRNCVYQVKEVVKKMTKLPGLNVIVMDHVIPLMHEMKDYVQTTRGSSRDIRVEYEARCLRDIGLCYFYCNEHQRYANMNEYAIELMNKHFNNKAAKYYVYGNCLSNAGVAYGNLGEIEKSIEKYKMSLKVYGEANDWFSDEYKTDTIARTGNNLKINEAKLRNKLHYSVRKLDAIAYRIQHQ